MRLVLIVLLTLFCLQGLAKFAVWFRVPYERRIKRIASYYKRGGRVLGIHDTITLIIMVVSVVLLLLTQMDGLSFVTGLIAGMVTIQLFFHRFNRPLPETKMPQQPVEPRELMSYARQAQPTLAWREIAFMTALLLWALYLLVSPVVSGSI